MRRRFPIIIPVIIGLSLLAVLIFGTNMMGRYSQTPRQYGTTQQGRNLNGGKMLGVNPINTPNINMSGYTVSPSPTNNFSVNRISQQMAFDKSKASNITNQLTGMNGIKKAHAVVNGNTALVGFIPTNAKTDTRAMINTITNKIKLMDTSITNVVVTDSKDATAKISRLADSIKNNSNTKNLTNEFNRLTKSIKPKL